jgi:hypothetical protein
VIEKCGKTKNQREIKLTGAKSGFFENYRQQPNKKTIAKMKSVIGI